MKKIMILAAMFAVAMSANAQWNNSNRNDAPRPTDQRYDNKPQTPPTGSYEQPYDNRQQVPPTGNYGQTYDNNRDYQGSYNQRNDGRYGDYRRDMPHGRNEGFFLDELQRDAQIRLKMGIERGLITQNESRKLWRQLEFIKDKKYRFEANGYLNPREKDELVADFRDLNVSIDREMHDRDYYSSHFGERERNWRRGF